MLDIMSNLIIVDLLEKYKHLMMHLLSTMATVPKFVNLPEILLKF